MAIVTALGAAGAGLISIVGWLTSLPKEFTYLIFLAGLTLDTGVSVAIGTNGLTGFLLTTLVNGILGTNIVITSFQGFIIFLFIPVILFMLKNSLSHQ